MSDNLLPGEVAPLPRRYGGRPLTDDEVLGVARRHARALAETGRTGRSALVPDALPPGSELTQSAFRLPTVLMMRVKARAEVEGRTLTAVVRELLEGYGASAPGTVARFELPPTE